MAQVGPFRCGRVVCVWTIEAIGGEFQFLTNEIRCCKERSFDCVKDLPASWCLLRSRFRSF